MNFLEAAKKVFEFDEGRIASPYRDTKGLYTIGIGHLLGASLQELELSNLTINQIFYEDLERCLNEAYLVLGKVFFESQTLARKIAILTLFFTMGGDKVAEQFHDTIEAMKREDWDDVAARVLKWKWARDVDPKQRPGEGRDDRIAYMMATGLFHKDYGIADVG